MTTTELLAEAWQHLDEQQREQALQLIRAIDLCGPVAREMIVQCAQGHIAGREYGDWGDESLDYAAEAAQEARDGVNYCSANIRKLRLLERARANFEQAQVALITAGQVQDA